MNNKPKETEIDNSIYLIYADESEESQKAACDRIIELILQSENK